MGLCSSPGCRGSSNCFISVCCRNGISPNKTGHPPLSLAEKTSNILRGREGVSSEPSNKPPAHARIRQDLLFSLTSSIRFCNENLQPTDNLTPPAPPPRPDGCLRAARVPGRSSRPGISESTWSTRRPVGTPVAPPGAGNSGGGSPGNPGGGIGGGGAESSLAHWGEGGVRGAAGEVARVSSAVGGGNTDANRPVGVPYPFRAAAAKHGGAGGAANETLLR